MSERTPFFNNKLFWVNKLLSKRGYPEAVEIVEIHKASVHHLYWAAMIIYYKRKNNGSIIQLTIPFPYDEETIEWFVWYYIAEPCNDEINNN